MSSKSKDAKRTKPGNALDHVDPRHMFGMIARGFELQDVAGCLFVWSPKAVDLFFKKLFGIADWIRSTWKANESLGMQCDCILQIMEGSINLLYIDEQNPVAVYEMTDIERQHLKDIPFIYMRSFRRKEVQVCLPEER